MEKLLVIWRRNCIHKDIPLSLEKIQKRVISFYRTMMRECGVEKGKFSALGTGIIELKVSKIVVEQQVFPPMQRENILTSSNKLLRRGNLPITRYPLSMKHFILEENVY